MKLDIGRQVFALIVLVALLGVVSVFSKYGPHRGNNALDNQPAIGDTNPPPPLTEHMQKVFEASTGFAVAVSYTNNGFEPPNITIKRGQTVRFINNSVEPLWIMSTGPNVYPGKGNNCGQSAFDSCVTLPRYDIWEFTFNEAGDWNYRNNLEQTHTASIRVK